MTPSEAFELGFLLRCVEEGLPPDGVRERVEIVKQQQSPAVKSADGLVGLLGTLGGFGAGLAVAAPPVLGYGAGAVAAKALSEDVDPEDVQKQELIAEYRRLAARARRQAELKRILGTTLPA